MGKALCSESSAYCSNVVPTLYNVVRTLCNVVSTLFQRRALTLYQNWKRRILFRFQRRINVISTLFDPSLNCWPEKETNIGQWPYFNTNVVILQLESVTEITQADHTANIKANDNPRSDKKSNNSRTLVISKKKNIVLLSDSMIKQRVRNVLEIRKL